MVEAASAHCDSSSFEKILDIKVLEFKQSLPRVGEAAAITVVVDFIAKEILRAVSAGGNDLQILNEMVKANFQKYGVGHFFERCWIFAHRNVAKGVSRQFQNNMASISAPNSKINQLEAQIAERDKTIAELRKALADAVKAASESVSNDPKGYFAKLHLNSATAKRIYDIEGASGLLKVIKKHKDTYASVFHPDKLGHITDPEKKRESESLFKGITEAFHALDDTSKIDAYMRSIKPQR